jgi:[acyl-carrier-protein] S-malonyltransferase
MTAVLGLSAGRVEAVCAELGEVWLANDNSPDQVVLSGRADALTLAAEACERLGARATVPLDVPVANHTPLMRPAVEPLRDALEQSGLTPPRCRFYSGVDARAHSDPTEITSLLAAGVATRVRFADTIRAISSDGVTSFLELGPGKILCRLVKQVDAATRCRKVD